MSETPTGLIDFQNLLKVQGKDSAIDLLKFRREHLPEHAEIARIEKHAGELRPSLQTTTAVRDEAAAEQARLEAEVVSIDRRIAEINARLLGQTPVGAKDAQAMSTEIEHLKDRRRGLEDQELEIMERMEPLEQDVAKLESMARDLAGEMQRVQAAIALSQKEIDSEIAEEEKGLGSLIETVPSSLLSEYQMLRSKLGGVAAAALVGASCGGCHLTLAPSELEKLRNAPESQVIHCDECGRILVR